MAIARNLAVPALSNPSNFDRVAGRPKPRLLSGHDNAGQLDPLPYHATNIALHGIASLLVYR